MKNNYYILGVPNILCIQIQRFKEEGYNQQKIVFNTKHLDIKNYILKNDKYYQQTDGYRLIALIDFEPTIYRYRSVVYDEDDQNYFIIMD